MNNHIRLTLTTTLVLLSVVTAESRLPSLATAASAESVAATKQTKQNTITTNSYRASYEKAIKQGIISRPSGVENEDEAMELAYLALNQGNQDEATARFAQALVIISEKQGVTAALAREKRLDANLRAKLGQGLRECLPLFGRVFPSSTPSAVKPSTPYRTNYERAIARNIIKRPSPVEDTNRAIELAYQAMEQGDRNEAAIRFAQALVIISENEGATKALAFERRLDAEILDQRNQTLRGYLPLFGRIFPLNSNSSR